MAAGGGTGHTAVATEAQVCLLNHTAECSLIASFTDCRFPLVSIQARVLLPPIWRRSPSLAA